MHYDPKRIAEHLGVPEDRLRYARSVVLRRDAAKPIEEPELLLLLLYDLLTRYMPVDRANTAMMWLGGCLDGYAAELPAMLDTKEVKLLVVQVFDSRFIGLGPMRDNVYDLTEFREVPKAPMPATSLAIVLPELFRRFLEAEGGLPGSRSEGEGPPGSEPSAPAAP